MKRNIVNIDENKCNGCGLCVTACHEHAIEIVNGKAKLVSDMYCDGLGDCLPACPQLAIQIIEREADAYDDDAVKGRIEEKNKKKILEGAMPCGCPGTAERKLERKEINKSEVKAINLRVESLKSELMQWPVQLKLVNSNAEYFKNANLLVAADCTAYAYANFHSDFIKNHVTVIGCPKLDDNEYYVEKLKDILINNNVKSITVVRMEVPCCSGIVAATKKAMLKSEVIVPYKEVTISCDGNIIE